MERILIIGAGITGSLSGSLLRSDMSAKLSIWDKAKGAGGRMSTSRHSDNDQCTVDLGAQYISAVKEDYQKNKRFYDELTESNILSPLQGTIEGDRSPEGTHHYVTPKGVSSIVKHYLKSSGADIRYNQRVVDISEENNKWKVTCESKKNELFDAVILTMPVQQILQLQGTISTIFDSQPVLKKKLEQTSYSSRYALGLFYEPGTKINMPWCAKYFDGQPSVRFVAIDSKKRGIDDEHTGPSVAVHASVPFSLQHLEELTDSVCSDIILPEVLKLLPQLPNPKSVKNHKWRYSQVHKGFEGSPGAIIAHKKPLLVLTGDAFSKSGFDGCLNSALKTKDIFKQCCD